MLGHGRKIGAPLIASASKKTARNCEPFSFLRVSCAITRVALAHKKITVIPDLIPLLSGTFSEKTRKWLFCFLKELSLRVGTQFLLTGYLHKEIIF
jgi:hypothetical protein